MFPDIRKQCFRLVPKQEVFFLDRETHKRNNISHHRKISSGHVEALLPVTKEKHMQTVATESQRRIRLNDLAKQEEEAQKELEEARKNKGFTQVYPKGWKRIIELSKQKGGSGPAGLYAFFAQHIDPSCGAVVCDQQFLADQFEVSTRTIRNWLTHLEQENALLRIPVSGRVCAYALDPHEVWKGYNISKEYAAFVTKTLVNKDGDIKRRIMSMFSPEERPDDRDTDTLDMFGGEQP